MSKVSAEGRPAAAEQKQRSRRSTWTRRGVKLVAFGAAAAVGLALGVAAGVTAAGAAPLETVSASACVQVAGTQPTTPVGTVTLAQAPVPGAVKYTATATPANPVTYAVTGLTGLSILPNGLLLAGTAVPGVYPIVQVSAKTAALGSTPATDTCTLTVRALPVPTVPFVFGGHVLTVSAHNATVAWSDGLAGNQVAWGGNPLVNGHVNHCVEVYVYGFDTPPGTAHVGFTCDNGVPSNNVGFLRDLPAGHTVALSVRPAVGTYGNHHPIPNTNPAAHIEVVTAAA